MNSATISSDLPPLNCFRTYNGKAYVVKMDVFKHVHNMVIQQFSNLRNPQEYEQLLKFLTPYHKSVGGVYQYVAFDDLLKVSDDFDIKTRKNWQNDKRGQLIEKKIQAFARKFGTTTTSRKNATVEQLRTIEELYRNQGHNAQDNKVWLKIALKTLEEIIPLHPKLFNPSVDSDAPKFVRLFTDDMANFVIAEELDHVLNGTEYTKEPMKTWKTLDGAKAVRIAGDALEFFKVPIHRYIGTHQAYPLVNPTGTFCKLSVDVLLELIRDVLGYKTEEEQNVEAAFKMIDDTFSLDDKDPVFMDEDRAKELVTRVKTYCFRELGMTSTISTHPNERQLDASADLRIAEKIGCFPRLAAFFHNQKACHRLKRRTCCEPSFPVPVQNAPVVEEEIKQEPHAEMNKNVPVPVPNDLNKERNKKRKEKANKIKAIDPEVTEAILDSVAKVSKEIDVLLDASKVTVEKPATPEPIVQAPNKQKESATCQKCLRTSNRCKEAKAQLKESQNYAKKLEKELAELKKKMEIMEQNHATQMEEQQKEQEALKVLVVSLKQENKQLKQKTVQKSVAPVAVVAPIQKERSLEVKQKLIEFQVKLDEFRAFDPIGKAAQEIRQLTTLTKIQTVRDHCEYEMLVFKEKSKKYESTLEKNIELIQSNISTTIADLIHVPEYPVLPEVFYRELKKAQDQDRKNKELENECIICTEPMDKQTEDELFQCPECNKKVHLPCISQWFDRSNSCPCCRTKWT